MFESVSIREKKDFMKNLGVMLKSGMAINDALGVLEKQAKSAAFQESVGRVQKRIIAGESLARSLESEEKFFGKIAISIARAGENSGMLAENLIYLAHWFERSETLRRETQAALLYPKIVISVTVLLGGVLSIFVLPKLIPLFDSLNVELPGATKFLIASIAFVQSYWLLVIIGIVAAIVGMYFLNRRPSVRRLLHGVYLRIPVTGELLKNYQLALLTQVLETLMHGGMTLHETLIITRDAMTNMQYRAALEKIRVKVQGGSTFSKAAAQMPDLFSVTFVSIIEVGEKTGSLHGSIEHLQEHYSSEVSALTKKIPQVIEPVLLVGIALVVGFVAIAIISPLYEVTQGLSR